MHVFKQSADQMLSFMVSQLCRTQPALVLIELMTTCAAFMQVIARQCSTPAPAEVPGDTGEAAYHEEEAAEGDIEQPREASRVTIPPLGCSKCRKSKNGCRKCRTDQADALQVCPVPKRAMLRHPSLPLAIFRDLQQWRMPMSSALFVFLLGLQMDSTLCLRMSGC